MAIGPEKRLMYAVFVVLGLVRTGCLKWKPFRMALCIGVHQTEGNVLKGTLGTWVFYWDYRLSIRHIASTDSRADGCLQTIMFVMLPGLRFHM